MSLDTSAHHPAHSAAALSGSYRTEEPSPTDVPAYPVHRPRLERWQTAYLPVNAVWGCVVVVVFPPLFGFK